MKQNFFHKAFTMAETLITLSLIGVLAITMISLNDFSSNNAKIASQKLSQTDAALQSWSKAITKSNETGLGATTFANADDSTQAIAESIKDYLANNKSETLNGLTVDNYTYDGTYENITLNNGVTIKVKFVANKESLDNKTNILAESNLAVITASVKENKNDETPLSEEYALKSSGLKSLASVFEGWKKYEIETVDTQRMYCEGKTECADGCDKAPEFCTVTEAEGQYIYIKEDSKTACPSGQNGSITVQQIGSVSGVFEATIDTCCPNPKEYVSTDDEGNKVCGCPSTFVAQAGYEKNDDSITCQTPCLKGQYEKDHVCILCDKNKYCPSDMMTESKTCKAGSYCPNDKTKTIDTNYNAKKYILDEDNKVTKVEDGGLINAQVCQKGNYCPKDDLENQITCPKAHYCPTDGLITPVPCPAGTVAKKDENGDFVTGATSKETGCVACDASKGLYQDEEGKDECKKCDGGAIVSSDGKSCEICQAGTYFDGKKCVLCPKGHKCPNEGMTKPDACPCGYYQPREGQTECYLVPAGAYATTSSSYVKSAAQDATVCPAGYKCAGACNDKVACTPGHYQDKTGKNYCEICPTGHKCPNSAMVNPTECPRGTYQDETGQVDCEDCPAGYKCPNEAMVDPIACTCGTYQNEERQTTCKNVPAGKYPTINGRANLGTAATGVGTCTAGYRCAGGCSLEVACTGNTYSHAGYSSCPACPNVCNYSFGCGSTSANSNHTSCSCGYYEFYYDGWGGYIALTGKSSAGDTFTCYGVVHNTDPVILDLKDNGIKLTSVENGIIFDVLGTGKKVKTAWTDVQTEFDDAFLCQDINGNGRIDDGSELFGDQNGAENGLVELAKYDDNKDGVINKDDAIYERLLLWVDFNKDGVTDPGELKPMKDENITEISTSYNIEVDENGNVKVDEHGNKVGIVGTFKRLLEDGTEAIGKLIDAFFKVIDNIANAVSGLFD